MNHQILLAQLSKNIASQASSSASDGSASLGTEIYTLLTVILSYGQKLLVTGILLISAYILGRLISSRVVRKIQQNRGDVLYQDLESLISKSITYGCVFSGFAVALEFVFNIDFIQIIGFFGLGIGFAFKDLLSNLIAGVVIILQNRFHVGDFVSIGGSLKGKIMEIQTRATILKAIDGTEIIVPNADLLQKTVQSFTAHHTRRITIPIKVHLHTNLDLAIALLKRIVKSSPHVLKKPLPKVIVKELGYSGISLATHFYIDPQDKTSSWLTVKSGLLKKIQEQFIKNGITIAFPHEVFLDGTTGEQAEGRDWMEKADKTLLIKKKKKPTVLGLNSNAVIPTSPTPPTTRQDVATIVNSALPPANTLQSPTPAVEQSEPKIVVQGAEKV